MALATSIDALAVGIAFAFLQVNIWGAIAIIGVTTFLLSIVGVFIGLPYKGMSHLVKPKKSENP
jgi:putative Mn2+ efflux pump MntP